MCDEGAFAGCMNPALGFFYQYAEQYCAKIFACCSSQPETGFGSQEECEGFVGGLAGSLLTADIQANWIRMDVSKADACISHISARFEAESCEETNAHFPLEETACRGLFTGLLGEGDVCGQADEDGGVISSKYACTDGLICHSPDAGLPVCVTAPVAGEACESFGSRVCASGLACVGGVCAAPLAVGEACNAPSECASGVCDGTCVTGLAICGG
jgi:hypothetical protein